MKYGFITSFDAVTGIGFLDSTLGESGILFYVNPANGPKFEVGQRVSYHEAVRAVGLKIDSEELGVRIK